MLSWTRLLSTTPGLLACLALACSGDPLVEPVDTPVLTVSPRNIPPDSSFGSRIDVVARVSGLKRLSGHLVEFREDTGLRAPALLLNSFSAPVDGYRRDTTDAFGGVTVTAFRNGVAGSGALYIRVKALQLADSILFTTLPRRARFLSIDPRDTTILVGRSAVVRVGAADQYSQPLAPPSLSADSGNVRVTGNRVDGLSIGRARVTASKDGLQEAMWVTVAPAVPLTLHLSTFSTAPVSGIYLQSPDGSDRRLLLPDSVARSEARPIAWSSDGKILWHNAFGVIRSVRTDGSSRAWPASIFNDARGVSPSRDGRFVYYSGVALHPFQGRVIWRVDTSTGDHEQVGPPSASVYISDEEPSISPDGRTIAFVTNRRSVNGQTFELATFDLPSGRLTYPGTAGRMPRWSPDGQWIAYTASARLWITRADGSGARMVSAPGLYVFDGADWSPDSRWLVGATAYGTSSSAVTLFELATGKVLPLSGTSGASGWAWQP